MIHPDEALRRALALARRLPAETLALKDAAGRRLAAPLRAAADLPAFDNSAMDGYALRAKEARGVPATFAVDRTIAAGAVPGKALRPGSACRIMTGAPLPPGADAVVMRELTRESGSSVAVLERPGRGQHVRLRGGDVRAGELLLEAGVLLGPAHIALMAAQGIRRVSVVRRPRVALLVSGDELVAAERGGRLKPGQLRDATTPGLRAALESWGCVVARAARLRDEPAAIAREIPRAAAHCDALIVTGGVSVGDFDYTRAALAGLGFKESFWRTAIRPGKPLLCGGLKGRPVFGLPGNPVSTLVTAEVFVKPVLELMGGRPAPSEAFPETGILAASFEKKESLRQFLFCRARKIKGKTLLTVIEPQGSGRISMAARADALAVADIGESRLKSGREVPFKWL